MTTSWVTIRGMASKWFYKDTTSSWVPASNRRGVRRRRSVAGNVEHGLQARKVDPEAVVGHERVADAGHSHEWLDGPKRLPDGGAIRIEHAHHRRIGHGP